MLQNKFVKTAYLSAIVFLFCPFIADVCSAKTKVIRTGKIVRANKFKYILDQTGECYCGKDGYWHELNFNFEKHLLVSSKIKPETELISGLAGIQGKYQPYLQFGGTRFIRIKDSLASLNVDLFIPVWQQNLTDLVFVDFRFKDFTGTPYEGNIHLGYRHLFADNNMLWGAYVGFDRRKTEAHNYFNQLMLGGEYWYKRFFIGGNFYNPVGSRVKNTNLGSLKDVDYIENGIYHEIIGLKDQNREKALSGIDGEVGYEVMDGLVGYLGGYYFKGSEADTVCGPRVRVTYEWGLGDGQRILGVFDNFNLEAGVQRDKPRGTVWYLSASGKIGWLFDKKTELQGVSLHMVDQVHRDIDVVATKATPQKAQEKLGRSIIVDDAGKFADAINDESVTVIDVRFSNARGMREDEVIAATQKTSRGKPLVVIVDGYINKKILYGVGPNARKLDRISPNKIVEGEIGVDSMPKFVELLNSLPNVFVIHFPDLYNRHEYRSNQWTRFAHDFLRLIANERQSGNNFQKELLEFDENDLANQ